MKPEEVKEFIDLYGVAEYQKHTFKILCEKFAIPYSVDTFRAFIEGIAFATWMAGQSIKNLEKGVSDGRATAKNGSFEITKEVNKK